VTRDDIVAAAVRIAGRVRTTPVLDLEPGAFGVPGRLSLKLELHQHSGSFKARGAFNLLLAVEVPETVVIASGGNAGLAIAYAARELGRRATVFIPEVTGPAKVGRLRAMGAQVVVAGAYYADALEASRRYAAQVGALVAHAYDQPEIVAGQGTCGRELAAQRPGLDTVMVAVGGGGLIGGIATWYADRARVVAVESERTATLASALAAGRPVDVEVGGLVADSLGARRAGAYGFEAARRWVDEAVLVPDEAIAEAQQLLWEHTRVLCEPGSAAPLAALIGGAYSPGAEEWVGVVVCGANLDPASFGRRRR
jgi:threonine dehydratase